MLIDYKRVNCKNGSSTPLVSKDMDAIIHNNHTISIYYPCFS